MLGEGATSRRRRVSARAIGPRYLGSGISWRLPAASLTITRVPATRRHGAAALERARAVLQTLQLVQLGAALLDAAGMLDPLKMRSLDAIHLAAAALIAPELTALVTYDARMAEGAALLGFPVASPA